MNIRTILVPVDFTSCSLRVTQQAAQFAARLGARVVVLHVAELPVGLPPDARVEPEGVPRSAADYVVADARTRLAGFEAEARAMGAGVEIDVRVGPVVQTILAAAEATHADLVVMGTHGRTGAVRFVLGSVAEGVARRAHMPVMLLRRESRPDCKRESCEWCPLDGRSPAEVRILDETTG